MVWKVVLAIRCSNPLHGATHRFWGLGDVTSAISDAELSSDTVGGAREASLEVLRLAETMK
jgi:hypothetical protein